MKLIELYKEILQYCGLRANKQGMLETDLTYMGGDDGEKDYAVEIDDKNVFLPTEENLKTANKNGDLIFHPFHEQRNTGDSEVFTLLRRSVLVRINFTAMILGRTLLEVAANPSMQRGISRELREMISDLPDVDARSSTRWLEFIGKVLAKRPVNGLVDIFIKRQGHYQGKVRPIVGVVRFGLFKDDPGFEFKFKKNEVELFTKVYETIFPYQGDDNYYGFFSDHRDIPRLDTLLRTANTVAERLNHVTELLADYLPYRYDMAFQADFLDQLEDLDPYRKEIRMIPPQKGNQGHAEPKEEEEDQKKDAGSYLPKPPERPTPQGNTQMTQPYMQPVQNQYYQQPQQMQPVQQPMYQQPPQVPAPQQPQLATTDTGKLDFNSVEQVNPMVAAAGYVQTPLNEWQRQQMQPAGVPVVDPRTGMTYYAPMQPQQMYQPGVPVVDPRTGAAYYTAPPAMPVQQQVPLDAWGRPMMQQPMPGQYQQQVPLDAWGRPIGRPVAQPAYPHGAVR